MGGWSSTLRLLKVGRQRDKRYSVEKGEKIALECHTHNKCISRSNSIHQILHNTPKSPTIVIDCKGRQISQQIISALHQQADETQSLHIVNYPINCRICVYTLFRTLDFTQFTVLTQFILIRDYRDECFIKLNDVQFPLTLEIIKLEGIGLTSVPLKMASLHNLKVLSLRNNIICSLNELLDDHKLNSLEELYIADNRLSILTKDLSTLTKLKLLDASANQIKTLKMDPSNMTNLQKVFLSWNRLEIIPETFIVHKSLTHLDLAHNKLKLIPIDSENLSKTRLKTIFLTGNPISKT